MNDRSHQILFFLLFQKPVRSYEETAVLIEYGCPKHQKTKTVQRTIFAPTTTPLRGLVVEIQIIYQNDQLNAGYKVIERYLKISSRRNQNLLICPHSRIRPFANLSLPLVCMPTYSHETLCQSVSRCPRGSDTTEILISFRVFSLRVRICDARRERKGGGGVSYRSVCALAG